MEWLKNNKKIVIIVSVIITLLVTIILILSQGKTKEYEVIFDTKGGTTVSSKKVLEGEKIQKPKDPKKEGYLFLEWYLDGKAFNFNQEIRKKIKLEAKWYKLEKETTYYTVKFNSEGGTNISNQIIEEGKTVNKPNDPQKEGYTFKYWMLNNEEYNFDTEVTEDIELTAKYEKNTKPTQKVEEETKVEVPTLTNVSGTRENEIMYSNLNITAEGKYASGSSQISGYEVYEKNGSNYTKIGESETLKDIKVDVEKGEIQTYVARAYVYNKSNKKVYSDYSNEIKVDNSNIDSPTLTNASGSKENDIMHAKLGILVEEPYSSGKLKISGFELYEKKGNNYTKVEDSANLKDINVIVNPGETKIYVAKAYLINKSGKKVYSEYSNEVKIIN